MKAGEVLRVEPSRVDGRPRALVSLDRGGAVVVLSTGPGSAYCRTPDQADRSAWEYVRAGEFVAECGAFEFGGVEYVHGSAYFDRDSGGAWVESGHYGPDLWRHGPDPFVNGKATPKALAAWVEAVRVAVGRAWDSPGFAEAAVEADRAARVQRVDDRLAELGAEVDRLLDERDSVVGRHGPRVEFEGGRPVVSLDGVEVGLSLEPTEGVRLGVDFDPDSTRTGFDGLRVGEHFASASDDFSDLIRDEPDAGRVAARRLAESVDRALADRYADDSATVPSRSDWALWSDLVDSGPAFGFVPSVEVEARLGRLSSLVRAGRAWVVAFDDDSDDGLANACRRIRVEVARILGRTRNGFVGLGPRGRALLRTAKAAAYWGEAFAAGEAGRADGRTLADELTDALGAFGEVVES